MAKLAFKNYYATIGKKEEFYTEQKDKESLTDQSQLANASLTEMAKKYGIDAMIAKAEQATIEAGKLQDILYGNDFTQMFKSREDLLNTKKRISNIFENIPARMRKELFNDDVKEFVHTYTGTDEKKLEALNKIGMISDTQLQAVKKYNANIKAEQLERETKDKFIQQLESMKEGLYEKFKESGALNSNDFIQSSTATETDKSNLS